MEFTSRYSRSFQPTKKTVFVSSSCGFSMESLFPNLSAACLRFRCRNWGLQVYTAHIEWQTNSRNTQIRKRKTEVPVFCCESQFSNALAGLHWRR